MQTLGRAATCDYPAAVAPDPLRFFYRHEYNEVSTSFSRDYPFVGYSGTDQLQLAQRRRPLTLADFKADRPDRPRVRKDFPETLLFAPAVITGADGNAEVDLTMAFCGRTQVAQVDRSILLPGTYPTA